MNRPKIIKFVLQLIVRTIADPHNSHTASAAQSDTLRCRCNNYVSARAHCVSWATRARHNRTHALPATSKHTQLACANALPSVCVLSKSEKVCCDCEHAHMPHIDRHRSATIAKPGTCTGPDRRTTTTAGGMHDIHVHTYTMRARTRSSAYYKISALMIARI